MAPRANDAGMDATHTADLGPPLDSEPLRDAPNFDSSDGRANLDAPPERDAQDAQPVDVGTDATIGPSDARMDVTDARTDGSDAAMVSDVAGDIPGIRDAGDAGPCVGPILINELQTTGIGGVANDEFVELYNAGTCEVVLEGWLLVYRSQAGVNPVNIYNAFTAMDRLAPGAYMVLAGDAFMPMEPSLRRLRSGIARDNGGVAIVSPSAVRVDSVGWGTVAMDHPFVEPMIVPVIPAAAAPSGAALARLPNASDTNSNATDFRVTMTPTPGASNR